MQSLSHNQSKKTSNLFNILVILLTGLSILNTIRVTSGSVGTLLIIILSILSIFAISIYVLKYQEMPKFLFKPSVQAFIFLGISSIGMFLKSDLRFFVTIYQFVTVFSFFIVCSVMKWDNYKIKLISRIAFLLIFINFILFVKQGFPSYFSGIFVNPNGLGALLFLLTFFVLLRLVSKKTIRWSILLLLSVLLIYFSGTRSVLIGLCFAFVTYILWGLITKEKKTFIFYFLLVFGGIMSFTFLYPQAIYWPDFQQLDYVFYEQTGKSLFTGREVIWSQLFEIIKDHLWLGHGAGTVPSDVLHTNLSSHNLYLQIALQTGIIGLGVFLLLLLSIWRLYYQGHKDKRVRLSAAFFIGIVLQQTFEVSLIQNNMSTAYIQWIIIAIGVSISQYTIKDLKHVQNNHKEN